MNIIETLFGRSVTPAERLRQHQRSLAKAQRELDRERGRLEQSEKKLVGDIKKSAKNGEMGACKVMAKDLVRTRRYIHKFYQMRTQLQAVGLRIQTLRSNQQMGEAMRGATRAMASMNKGLNLPAIQRIMTEFEKESAMMDMKDEMMSDAVDDVMEDAEEDEEAEGDKILKEVMDEIGVGLAQQVCFLLFSRSQSKLLRTYLVVLSLQMHRLVLHQRLLPLIDKLSLLGKQLAQGTTDELLIQVQVVLAHQTKTPYKLGWTP
jgi:charged multivesicular body protein 2A